MSILKRVTALITLNGNASNSLDRAEEIGKVELEDWFGTRRASITIGEWGDARIQIWGSGSTSKAALEEAIKKATIITDALGAKALEQR